MKQENSEILVKNKDLQNRNSENESKIQEYLLNIQKLKNSLDDQSRKLKDNIENLEKSKEKEKESSEKIKENLAKITQLESQKRRLEEDNQEMCGKLRAWNIKGDSMNSRIIELQKNNDEFHANIEILQKETIENKQLLQDNEEYTTYLKELLDNTERFQGEIETFWSLLSSKLKENRDIFSLEIRQFEFSSSEEKNSLVKWFENLISLFQIIDREFAVYFSYIKK